MKFDYMAPLAQFWQNAPDKPGYKHVYAALFCAFMDELRQSGNRSINVSYRRINGLLKLSEEAYFGGLKWLDEAGFWQYMPGKNRFKEATIYVEVPFLPSAKDQPEEEFVPDHAKVEPDRAGSMIGSTIGSIQALPIVEPAEQDSTGGFTQVLGDFPPPHTPPLEVKNNFQSDRQAASRAEGEEGVDEKKPKDYIIPANINLKPEQEATLLAAWGPERLQKVLLRISAFKYEEGDLKTSDYNNAIKWAIRQVEVDEQTPPLTGRSLPHPATIAQSQPVRKPRATIT